jgi:parallel beta-helix repeat protein
MNAVQIYENGKVMPLTRSIPALDPYYFDIVSNGTAVPNGTEYTLTTLVMPSVFTSTDSQFYKGAQIWINSCNNNLKQLDITAYDPATAKITFASIGCDGYLTPNKDKFVIANLATTLRQGEIYIDRANQHVVAWPTNAANIANNNVTLSRITGGVFVGNASNVHISGIKFTRFSGDAVAKYAGSTGGDNIVIYKNVFSQNRGIGINLNAIKNVRIAKNDIHENSGGIALAKAERSIVSHNRVTSAILSGIRIYTGKDSWVHNNVVYRSGGHHGNAYTLGYLGNDGMLAEANFAKESNISLTLQQSQNMVYYQNTFYSPTEMWPMAAWGGKMTDGSNPRNVTIIGNTKMYLLWVIA